MSDINQKTNPKSLALQVLGEHRAQVREQLRAAQIFSADAVKRQKQNENSLASMMDLTPDTTAFDVVNGAASLASGVANLAGTITAIPAVVGAIDDASRLNDTHYQAYQRYQGGKATAQDMELLASPARTNSYENPYLREFTKAVYDNPTVQQTIERAQNRRQLARDILKGFDVSGIVHQDNRERLINEAKASFEKPWEQVKEGWDQLKDYEEGKGWKNIASGALSLVTEGGKTLLSNPAGTAEYIAENLPQVGVGALGAAGKAALVASNVSYAADNYNEGIENFQKANNGAMPSDEQRLEIGLWAGSTFAAEQVADAKIVDSFLGSNVIGASKEGFKKTLLAASKEVSKDLGLEAATEGYQTFAEGEAKLKPASAEDIYVGAVIGAGAGGGISGLANSRVVAGTAAKAIGDRYNKVADEAEEAGTVLPKSALFDKAVEARNPDLILNPGNGEKGNLDEALAVIHRLATDGKSTPEERSALKEQAKGIVDRISNETAALRSASAQGREQTAKELAELETQLAAMPADDPGRADQEVLAEMLREDLAKAAPSEEQQKALDFQLKKAEKRLANAQQLFEAVTTEDTPSSDLKSTIQKANAVVADLDEGKVAESRQAVKQVLVLSMASPQSLSPDDARSLASNPANALSQPERDYLSAYAEATEALAALDGIKQVNKEVLYGDKSKKQMGMVDYRERIGRALSSGNITSAIRSIQGLRAFADSHQAKAAAFTQALSQYETTGQPMQVVKDGGSWQVAPLTLSKDQMKALGKGNAYDIGGNSARLVQATVKESQAIQLTQRVMESAFRLTTADQRQQSAQVSPQQAPQQPVSTEQVSTPQAEQEAPVAPLSPSKVEAKPKTKAKDKDKAKKPETLDQLLDRAERDYRRAVRQNPISLYSVLKNKLTDSDLEDIYGSEWKKRFTSLKGKNGKALADMVEDGSLNDFLPANLQFGNGMASGLDAVSAAREVIVERLRERNYLTENTVNELGQLGVEIQRLEEALKNQSTESLQDELDAAINELANDAGAGDAATEVTASEPESAGTDSTVAEQAASTEPESGKLSALFDELNDLSKWIKQGQGSDAAGSVRPLVSVKDFLSNWLQGKTSPVKFIKDPLSEEQKAALRHFVKVQQAFGKEVTGLLARNSNPKYAFQNPAEYLMKEVDGKLVFDENVLTATSVAMLTWLNDTAALDMVKTGAGINSMLGRDSDHEVTDSEYAMFTNIGVRRSLAASSLGQRIVGALGIKPTKDAPSDVIPRLEASLGAYGLMALVKMGLLKQEEVAGDAYAKMVGGDPKNTPSQQFVKVVQDRPGVASQQVKALIDPLKGTQNVLEKLFGVEPMALAPTLEAVPFKQTQVKNSKKRVPKFLAKILDKKNKEQNFVAQDMFDLVSGMDMDLVMEMAGGVLNVDEKVHINKRLAAQAKNEGLKREIAHFKEFVENTLMKSPDALDTPFYFQHNMWKQQRVGISNNLVNPQSSKVHRYMVFRQSWETEVDPTDTQQMNSFKLRVLEGLGVKTDKQANEKSLLQWESKISNPKIAAGVDAMVQRLEGTALSYEQQLAIADAVKEGGEKFHSLSSLMALAHWKKSQGAKFTVRLTGEVDGVTNGPMLSHILLGAASTAGHLFGRINKGGFFQVGSDFKNYNIFRGSADAMDLYETTAKSMIKAFASIESPALNAIWAFTGKLDDGDGKVSKNGRDFVKKGINALSFGSAMDKIVEGMSDVFMDNIYKTIEKIPSGKASTSEVVAALNTLLNRSVFSENSTYEELLNHRFTEQQIAVIKATFAGLLGDSIKEVMSTEFAPFLERRQAITRISGLAFGLYDSVFQAAKEFAVNRLIEEGKLPTDAKGNAYHDLSIEQQKYLDDLMAPLEPVLRTFMSSVDKDRQAGISMVKSSRELNSSLQYQAIVRFTGLDKKTGNFSSMSTKQEGPGVSMVPFGAHSSDSGISHGAVVKTEALNIHDAHVAGMGIFDEVARNLNTETFKVLLDYSPAQATYEALETTVRGIFDLLEDPRMSGLVAPAIKKYLAESMSKSKFKGTAQAFLIKRLSDAKLTAYEADRVRLETLANLAYVDQYALEGAQYEVTDADRIEARKRLDGLSMTLPADLVEQLNGLDAVLKKTATSKPVATTQIEADESLDVQAILKMPNAQAIRLMKVLALVESTPAEIKAQVEGILASMEGSDVSLTEAVNTTLNPSQAAGLVQFLSAHRKVGVNNAFGTVGVPSVAASAALTSFFEANPQTDGKTLIRELNQQLASLKDNKTAQYYRKLLALLNKSLPSDTKVVYVTPETKSDDVMTMPASASRGWYVPSSGTVYVLSPDFVESGLTSELLIHELTHSALVDLIANPKTENQKALVGELKDMMAKAKAFIEDNNISSPEMDSAVSDVQEFVAYGMTHRAFQSKVLGKMTVPNRLGKLTTALQEFINKLLGLLMDKRVDESMEEVDGFTALVANVTQLFQEANQQQEQKAKAQADRVNRTFSMVATTPVNQDLNTEEIFNALDGTGNSADFVTELEGRIESIVTKLHGPFGAIKTQIQQQSQSNPQDAWLAAVLSGRRPFSSQALKAALPFTQKEIFAVEQIEAVLTAATEQMSTASHPVYRELEKLYTQAKEVMKGQIDQDLYTFLFTPQKTAGQKSNYLARFAALALGHEVFNRQMKFITAGERMSFKGKTFMQRLETLWRGMTDWLGARLTGTYIGQRGDIKALSLVQQLVDIEAKAKGVSTQSSMFDFMEPLETKAAETLQATKKKIGDIADSRFVKTNRFVLVRAAGSVVSITANDRVEKVIEGMQEMRDKINDKANGTLMGLVTYMKGAGQWVNALLLAGKQIEKQRKAVITDTALAVLAAFKNDGADLTAEQRKGLTVTFLRTGLHKLLDSYGMKGIQDFLEDPKALDAAIKEEQSLLTGYPEMHYYINQAHGLGFYRAREEVAQSNQMLNAYNIARLYGTGKPVPAHADAAEAVIERLTSLYALQYTAAQMKDAAKEVLRTEMNRGSENGVEMAMLMHRQLEKDAKEQLFKENPALMVHGYTPEILNPKTSFQVSEDPAEWQELLDKGYESVGFIGKDKADPNAVRPMLFVLRGGGLGRYQSSAMSLTSMGAKGDSKHGNYYNQNDSVGVANMQSMNQISAQHFKDVQQQFKSSNGFDPVQERKRNNFLLPLMNEFGQVVDYRYVMSAKNKDNLLDRDNDFAHILGTMAGGTYDKLASQEQNRTVLEALKEHYSQEFGRNPSGFVRISYNSNDARLREIWSMLPEQTKRDANDVWGKTGIWVPKNMVDVVFGYRKASLADAWEKTNPNAVEKLMITTVTDLLRVYGKMGKGMDSAQANQYSKRGAVVVRRAEAAWQEIVHEVKDFIVVKTGTVLLGNILSNLGLLAMKGVPVLDGLKYQKIALKAAMDYERDRHALNQLKAIEDTGYRSQSINDVRAEIVRLEDALARNPVTELIDSGLMPTIVEDITMEDNPYSYKSQMTHWVDEKTQKINKHVLSAGKFVYMSHDTPLYKFLSKTTQYSDFVARYAMYMHLTTRKDNPLSKEDAVYEASESFVNYDVPLPKYVQYLDDMGILPFIKYFLSIQRVLAKTFKENPLRVLSVLALNNMFGNLPMPTDSSMLVRIGNNPLDTGAFGLPSAMTEAMTIQSGMSLVK